MSEMIHETETPKEEKRSSGLKLALPFLIVMALLTVVAFIIPLRPTVSYSEKRELTKFPAFSWEALASGDYFDDITTWFSDTFPGRETWLTVSEYTQSLHGYSEISIVETDFMDEILNPVENTDPVPEDPTMPEENDPQIPDEGDEQPTEEEATDPEETEWGGIDAGEGADIALGSVIQIGDTAFNQLGFSSYCSDRYAAALKSLGDALAEMDVRLISAPAPTSVGIMIEEAYLEKLNCASQKEMVQYLHSGMGDNVITVDTYSALVAHNDEYLFFRTDHHWTALGAYYAYVAICEAAGMEAAPLDSFEVADQGRFVGSLYGKVRYPNKLQADNVYAYIPQGDLKAYGYYNTYAIETQVIHDKSKGDVNSKYMCFLGTDYPMTEIINESNPDGGVCLVIKDSFGNCFAPFLTQNYYKVYLIDYRKYTTMTVKQFVEAYDVDDVIFIPYLIATQDQDGAKMFERLCR